jgi:hypothetical protein
MFEQYRVIIRLSFSYVSLPFGEEHGMASPKMGLEDGQVHVHHDHLLGRAQLLSPCHHGHLHHAPHRLEGRESSVMNPTDM